MGGANRAAVLPPGREDCTTSRLNPWASYLSRGCAVRSRESTRCWRRCSYSFQMAREDLAKLTAGLSPAAMWARPFGLTSVGFHSGISRGVPTACHLSAGKGTCGCAVGGADGGRIAATSDPRGIAGRDGMRRSVMRKPWSMQSIRRPSRFTDGRAQAAADHGHRTVYAYRRTYPAACGTGDRRRKTSGSAAIMFPLPMRTLLLIPAAVFSLLAQQTSAPATAPATPPAPTAGVPPPSGNDEVLKRIDDLMWHLMLDDIARSTRSSTPACRRRAFRIRGRRAPAIR